MPPRPSDVLAEDPDMKGAARRILSKAAVQIGSTATNKYMRESGPTQAPNTQTGPGSLRIQQSRLARSLRGASFDRAAPEGVFDLSPTNSGAKLTYGSEVPYAAVHEYGLSGSVQVSAHQRTMTEGFGPSTNYPLTVQVSAHQRNMQMPKRPYLEPALEDKMDDVVEMAEEEAFKALFDED